MKFRLYDVVDLGIEPSKNDFDFEKYKKYVMVVFSKLFTLSVYLGINYDGYTFLIELPFEDVLHAIIVFNQFQVKYVQVLNTVSSINKN